MKIFLITLDVSSIAISIIIALVFSNHTFFISNNILEANLFHISILSPVWIFLLYLLDFYEIRSIIDTVKFIYNLFVFILLAIGSGALYFYLRSNIGISPKTVLLLTTIFLGFFICFSRYLTFKIFNRYFIENIASVGCTSSLLSLIQSDISKYYYKTTIALVNLNEHTNNLNGQLLITTDVNKFAEHINQKKIKTVLLAENKNGMKDKIQTLFPLLLPDTNYVTFGNFYALLNNKVPLDYIDNRWLLENIPHRDKNIFIFSKRIFDIFVSLIGLIVTGIIFPFIAIAIKLNSQGPLLYQQQRLAKNGTPFTLLKFRTMDPNAEENGPRWSMPNDKRITIVGKFLRKTYLDELPQFWNILCGDLSVVGPRPERPEFIKELERHIPFYDIRLTVKPGLTGWAQVNYQASSTIDESKEKFRYDLYYIKNRSFLLDLSIVLKTSIKIFR